MIITLKGATFTKFLDLNSWMIISDLVGVTSSNTVTKVTKGDTYTTTFTIDTGYTLTEENVSVVCNGVTKTLTWDKLTEGGKATLSFTPDATVYISIRATSSSGSTGGEDEGESGVPVVDTWYTDYVVLSDVIEPASVDSRGWVIGSDNTVMSSLVGKPINAVKLVTNSASGTVTVGVANTWGASSVDVTATGTFSKDTTKEIITVKLDKTITLTDGQVLVLQPSGYDINYAPYFDRSSGIGFTLRVPNGTGNTPWGTASNMNINWDVGYIVD